MSDYTRKERFDTRVLLIPSLIICFFGCLVGIVINDRRDEARIHFESGDWEIVILFEQKETTDRELRSLVNKMKLTDPVATYPEGKGIRKFYSLENFPQTPVPQPKYAQEYINIHEVPTKDVIYDIFKGPGALEKTRAWLKSHEYSNYDFEVQWRNEKEYFTQPFKAHTNQSELAIVAYYRSAERLYLWDGYKVLDLSQGSLTSNANSKGALESIKNQIEIYRQLGH